MSTSYLNTRNKLLAEALMNSKFYKDKKNYLLKEYEPGEAAARASAAMVGLPKDVYDAFPEQLKNLQKDFGHLALDFIGMFDPTPASDGLNMLWYFSEGDRVNAFFSAIGAAIPYIFDAIKLGFRVSFNALKGIKAGQKTSSAIKGIINAFFDVFSDFTNAISQNSSKIISFLQSLLPKAPQSLKSFINWCINKINLFSNFAKQIIGFRQYPLEKEAAAIENAFYDFFGDTLKNTKDAFTPDMTKRMQNIMKQPIAQPKTAAAQAGIWAALKIPRPTNDEQADKKNYKIPDTAIEIPSGKKER